MQMHTLALSGLLATSAFVTLTSAEPASPPASPAAITESQQSNQVEIPRLLHDIKQFKEELPTLPPAESADRWLDLATRAIAISRPNDPDQSKSFPMFRHVMTVLPPADTWDIMADRLATSAGNDIDTPYLKLLSAVLINDPDEANRQLDVIKSNHQRKQDFQFEFLRGAINNTPIASPFPQPPSDPDELPDYLVGRINALEHRYDEPPSLSLPDLVALIGQENSGIFLHNYITRSIEFYVPTGDDTRRLAQSIALERINDLTAPQWQLVTPDAPELFEALEARFPRPTSTQPSTTSATENSSSAEFPYSGVNATYDSYNSAQCRYLSSLIIRGEIDRALERLSTINLPHPSFWFNPLQEQLDKQIAAGHREKTWLFLQALVQKYPLVETWDTWVSLGLSLGKADEMTGILQRALSEQTLTAYDDARLRYRLAMTFFSAGQLAEGTAIILTLTHHDKLDIEAFFQVAEIGRLTSNQPLYNHAFTEIHNYTYSGHVRTEWIADTPQTVSRWQIEDGKFDDAIKTWTDYREQSQKKEIIYRGANFHSNQSSIAIGLLSTYTAATRYQEAVDILEQSPDFGHPDLAGLIFGGYIPDYELGTAVAKALAGVGRTAEAKRILESMLQVKGNHDPAFELRVMLGGDDLLPFLNQLFSRDSLEERPLIWKAVALCNQQRYGEAEAAINAAIAIDPTENDQYWPHRMRAYTVLADIADATGRTVEAEQLRNKVHAVQLGSRADRLYYRGLVTDALQTYHQALDYDPRSACIHATLAEKYRQSGDHPRANYHARQAFQFMPETIGAEANHCNDCIGLFQSNNFLSIADEVFTSFPPETTESASFHFLMGCVRRQQNRFAEARHHFQQAVQLNPAQIASWNELQYTGNMLRAPRDELDATIFTIRRLDPLAQYYQARTGTVRDLKQLWEVEAHAASMQPQPPTSLLTLAQPADEDDLPLPPPESFAPADLPPLIRNSRREGNPRESIRQHLTIQSIVTLIDGEENSSNQAR